MRRLLPVATLAAALVPAAVASGQGAPPPASQKSIISVRVGATFVESPCHLDFHRTLISPGRPWQPGDPVPPAEDLAPPDPDGCRGIRPVVLRRARHMTVTLLGQSPQMGATWFARGRSTPLTVRPVGQPPTAIWFLRLPLTSGKLVLHMWYPVRTSVQGAVTQDRADYKVAIRRRTRPRPRPVPTEPVTTAPPPTSYDDNGR